MAEDGTITHPLESKRFVEHAVALKSSFDGERVSVDLDLGLGGLGTLGEEAHDKVTSRLEEIDAADSGVVVIVVVAMVVVAVVVVSGSDDVGGGER